MLILSRKPAESIMIGNDVIVTVLSVNGKFVRLGISAPLEVAVHREEIYEKIQKQQLAAIQTSIKIVQTANVGEGRLH